MWEFESAEFSAETLYQFKLVRNNRLSPDGRSLIYTVQRIDHKTEKKYSDLWLADVMTGQTRQFTYGDFSNGSPKWSPDGRTLAFISNRDGDHAQIYLIPTNGGEARPLTKIKGDLGQFEWSPDGTRIAFILREPSAEELALEEDETKKKLGVVAYHITRLSYKADGAGFLPTTKQQLWVIDVATGQATAYTKGSADIDQLAWSPDGQTIAFVANLSADPDLAPDATEIYTVAAEPPTEPHSAEQFTQITQHKGGVQTPVYSPDGSKIAFLGAEGIDNFYENLVLYLVAANGGEITPLSLAYDYDLGNNVICDVGDGTNFAWPQWSADGTTIYVQLSKHGKQPIIAFDVATTHVTKVIDGVVGLFDFTPDRTQIVYFNADFFQPGELFITNLTDQTTRQLTHHNDWVQSLPQGELEEKWFAGQDGYRLQGWILKPPHFDSSQKYPAILAIHGGPQTAYGDFRMHEFFYLAAHGFVVFFCNPRGSQGYGNAHAGAIFGQWGSVDYDDLMAWTDVVSALPYIDENRLGVQGGSYGGFMTALIIGRTKRFQAACTQRAVTNFSSAWGSTDFNYLWSRLAGYKHPWQDHERYWADSPMSYIGNAVTPTLIIHSLADYRTLLEQSEQLFVALKVQGVPTEMVVFPDESHGLSRNGRTDRRVLRLRHLLRWFHRYLLDPTGF